MKKLLLGLFTLLLCSGSVFAQLGTDNFNVGSDDASGYSGILANGNNGGSGFGAWSITYGTSTGSFIGSPANDGMGTTGIGTTAFGFYSNGAAYLNAIRTIDNGMRVGDKLTFYWAMNWDANGGNKGFDFKNTSGTTIFNVNNGGSANITTTNGTAFTTFGTDPMLVTLERVNSSSYSFSMTPRNGADLTFTTTINTSDDLNQINIYTGQQNDGSGNRNIYFGNFQKTSKYQIPNGTSTNATSDITIPFLEINSGATVNVDANTDLTISGALTNAGTLNLLSNSTGNYAQILANSSSGAGTFSIQRTFTGSARWFYLGSPISSGTVADFSVSSGVINTGAAATTNIYYYDPSTANAGEGTWTKVPATTFGTVDKGFSIYLGGDATFGTLPVTLTASGNGFNDGAVTISLDNNNSGWNLVNNPYPSSIDWNAYHDANTTDLLSIYYIHDGGKWIGYDATANSGINSGTALIPPMQSFFVQNTGAGSLNLSLTNSHRSLVSNPSQNKTSSSIDVLKLRVEGVDSNNNSDETLLAFDTQYTDGWDLSADAIKRMNSNSYPNLYSLSSGGDEHFVNKLNDNFTTKSIPLAFSSGIQQAYAISLSDIRVPKSWVVELEDALTGNRVDLRLGNYQFSHVPGASANRFIVHINKMAIGEEEVTSNNNYAYNSEDAFNFVLTQKMADVEVRIFSQTGQLVFESNYNEAIEEEISTSGFANGIYILKVSSKQAPVLTQKLVK